jgi:hypothetical protein
MAEQELRTPSAGVVLPFHAKVQAVVECITDLAVSLRQEEEGAAQKMEREKEEERELEQERRLKWEREQERKRTKRLNNKDGKDRNATDYSAYRQRRRYKSERVPRKMDAGVIRDVDAEAARGESCGGHARVVTGASFYSRYSHHHQRVRPATTYPPVASPRGHHPRDLRAADRAHLHTPPLQPYRDPFPPPGRQRTTTRAPAAGTFRSNRRSPKKMAMSLQAVLKQAIPSA